MDHFAVGGSHVCAASGSQIQCWGHDFRGLLDPPAGIGDVTRLKASQSSTCAVDLAGKAHCWEMTLTLTSTVPGQWPLQVGYQARPLAICATAIINWPQFVPWSKALNSGSLEIQRARDAQVGLSTSMARTSSPVAMVMWMRLKPVMMGDRLDGDGCSATCQTSSLVDNDEAYMTFYTRIALVLILMVASSVR